LGIVRHITMFFGKLCALLILYEDCVAYYFWFLSLFLFFFYWLIIYALLRVWYSTTLD
jgi:hypothetical protein